MALQDEPTSPLVVVLTSKQDAFMLALRARVALRIKPLSGSPTAPVAPPADSATVPAREAPIEEAPVPTLLRLDADFCLELARELLRSEL